MRQSIYLCLALAISGVVPSALAGQSTVTTSPSGFVRGQYTFDLSDGEPISWFLEYSEQLKLKPEQKTSLIAIRRRLRGENEHFMTRLDSAAVASGLTLGEVSRMTPDDRLALERFNKITAPTRDSIRANNDIARAEALTLLTSVQQTRLDSLVLELRRNRGRGPLRRPGAGGS
jgi:hypothetical protein